MAPEALFVNAVYFIRVDKGRQSLKVKLEVSSLRSRLLHQTE